MFRQELERLVASCEGGVGAVLMGFDGIAVDVHVKPGAGVDVNTVTMELSYVLTQVRKAIDSLALGGLQELTVRAESLTIVMRVLTSEYFVGLVLLPDGNLGRGRYLLRVAAPRIQAEL